MRVTSRKLFTLSKDRTISVLDSESGVAESAFAFARVPTCFAVSAKAGVLVCGSDDAYVEVG